MFDIGGWEFLLIAILAVIVIGPKELPGAIRTVSMFMRRARELAREFQSGIEEVARESELDKMTQGLKDAADPAGGIRRRIGEAVDPDNEIRGAMDFDPDWRDDDLVDFSGDYDDGNRIQPPAPPKTAPSEAQQAETSGGGDKTAAGEPSAAKPTETAGQAADSKPGNAT